MFSRFLITTLLGILFFTPLGSVGVLSNTASNLVVSSVSAAENLRVTQIPGFDVWWASHEALGKKVSGDDFQDKSKNTFLAVLKMVKIIVSIIAMLFIVIAGAQLVFSQGDEEALKKGKMQLVHAFLAFVFFTVPGELLRMFTSERCDSVTSDTAKYTDVGFANNCIVGKSWFEQTIGNNLSGFLTVFIGGFALLMFTYAAFLYLRSGNNEDRRVEAKNKLVYGTLGLILLGFTQAYIRIVSIGDFTGDTIQNALGTAFGMAAYLIVPLVIAFYLYASYLYIFSLGNEETVKKAKSVFLYATIGLFLFFGVYSLLADLSVFKI